MVKPGSKRVVPSNGNINRPVTIKPVYSPWDDPLSIETCIRWSDYGKRDEPNVCDNFYDRT